MEAKAKKEAEQANEVSKGKGKGKRKRKLEEGIAKLMCRLPTSGPGFEGPLSEEEIPKSFELWNYVFCVFPRASKSGVFRQQVHCQQALLIFNESVHKVAFKQLKSC